MIFDKEMALKKQIIETGRRLSSLRLVSASAGNLSARISEEEIFITVTGAYLGSLKIGDIKKVSLTQEPGMDKQLSTEYPLHRLIYKNFAAKFVIHCHPPLTNGYFAVYNNLKALTFESRIYLGDVPVIIQETPSITRPDEVIEALKANSLVVIKNHGVVCMTDEFRHGLGLIEALEETVRVTAVARLFDKGILDGLDKAFKKDITTSEDASVMFSQGHVQAIVDLVNQDELIGLKGKELDLTLTLAIKMDDTGQAYKFHFEKGRIVKLDTDANAPFVISAPAAVWEQVFLGRLDSFVAVTQGKMKLEGQLGQLSKWYVPFNRLFELFKEVKFKPLSSS